MLVDVLGIAVIEDGQGVIGTPGLGKRVDEAFEKARVVMVQRGAPHLDGFVCPALARQ
ncbi:hypothetical protein [Streptomyces sp. NPDC059402]|uniref:hypothetical protein n=1 Tax=Streptomyces sp. NPDC059402 TaxID=3346822 RepID=UPI00369CB31E